MLRLFQTLVRWQWPLRLLSPLFGDFNAFLPEFRVDPYPFYRRLQVKHRVYVSRLLGGTCLLSHYDDVVAVLTRSASGMPSSSAITVTGKG